MDDTASISRTNKDSLTVEVLAQNALTVDSIIPSHIVPQQSAQPAVKEKTVQHYSQDVHIRSYRRNGHSVDQMLISPRRGDCSACPDASGVGGILLKRYNDKSTRDNGIRIHG